MRLNEYQVGSQATSKEFTEKLYTKQEVREMTAVLEASTKLTEIAGKVKKGIFHKHENVELGNITHLEEFANTRANMREKVMTIEEQSILEGTIGILDEAGEVAEIVADHILYNKRIANFDELIKKELGDVLWYIAEVAKATGNNLEDIAMANLKKLEARYPGGFSAIASMNRSEEELAKEVIVHE